MKDPLQVCKTCNIPHDCHPDIDYYCAESHDLKSQLAHALCDRDDARRTACETLEWGYIAHMNPSSPFGYWRKHVAEVNKWDCYDEKETP